MDKPDLRFCAGKANVKRLGFMTRSKAADIDNTLAIIAETKTRMFQYIFSPLKMVLFLYDIQAY